MTTAPGPAEVDGRDGPDAVDALRASADMATRAWGAVVLVAGGWLVAGITLRMSLPAVAWGDVWPLAVIGLGLVIMARGVTRRS